MAKTAEKCEPDPNASDKEGHDQFGLRRFEVFWSGGMEKDEPRRGWHWWVCSPGSSLPESKVNGPYNTSHEAWEDAQAVK